MDATTARAPTQRRRPARPRMASTLFAGCGPLNLEDQELSRLSRGTPITTWSGVERYRVRPSVRAKKCAFRASTARVS